VFFRDDYKTKIEQCERCLQRVDRARIVSGAKELIVTVQPLDAGDSRDVIKINKKVRDVLGVKVGNMVKVERAYDGVMF